MLSGRTDDGEPDPAAARRAADAWLAGGVVGLPTETVYGLAADAQDADAVRRVYEAKGRPADHPLIVHVPDAAALGAWCAQRNQAAELLAAAFWPGALTVIVERGVRAGDHVTGGQDTVALRSPDHPVALACLAALARQSGDPARGVAAPSANRFGRVSPTRASDVLAEVGSRLDPSRDLVIDGGACAVGVESTIVDCTVNPPQVLRLGAVSQEQVDAVLGAGLEPVAQAESRDVSVPPREVRVPGGLEAHYAPEAGVFLVDMADGAQPEPDELGRLLGEAAEVDKVGLVALAPVATPAGWTRLFSPTSAEEYAHGLYAALRSADELGLEVIMAVLPDASAGALAVAVRDRLVRAAHRG